jgi:uncharacterized protein with HEPN domain
VKDLDRIAGWLDELDRTLIQAASLVTRGKDAYDSDPALPLAFEAICNRVGDLAKKLSRAQPNLFAARLWNAAARNRDFVVHHYEVISHEQLWVTVSRDFPLLAAETARVRSRL